jgi:aromatic-L-amino-acid decarboxylase
VEGLRHHVRGHVAAAQELASWIREDDRFELAVTPPLNLVCFRLRGRDEANEELLQRLNRSGALFLTHTRLDDRFVLRFSVGQTHTQIDHVRRAWERIRDVADQLLKG